MLFERTEKVYVNKVWEKTFDKNFKNEGEGKLIISLYCNGVNLCFNFTQYVQILCQKLRSYLNGINDFANITKNGWFKNGDKVWVNENISGNNHKILTYTEIRSRRTLFADHCFSTILLRTKRCMQRNEPRPFYTFSYAVFMTNNQVN